MNEKRLKEDENILDGGPSFCQLHLKVFDIAKKFLYPFFSFMSLYAFDEHDLIHAADAENGKIYWCKDCFGPVKRRKSKHWIFHFYHLKHAPSCRLYSKKENHLLAQIQLQKIFGKDELLLERPFLKINRVADALLEKRGIVFEIQCSQLTEKEAEMRILDYRSIGCEVVWLLDEERYNKRLLKPEEFFLRTHTCYFISIKKGFVYDQFEILDANQRLKRGRPLWIDLKRAYNTPKEMLEGKKFRGRIYFKGDRLFRAIYDPNSRNYWQQSELLKRPNCFKLWVKEKLLKPHFAFLKKIIKMWMDY